MKSAVLENLAPVKGMKINRKPSHLTKDIVVGIVSVVVVVFVAVVVVINKNNSQHFALK